MKSVSLSLTAVMLCGCVIAIDADDTPNSDFGYKKRSSKYVTTVSINDGEETATFKCAAGYKSFLDKSDDGKTIAYGCRAESE